MFGEEWGRDQHLRPASEAGEPRAADGKSVLGGGGRGAARPGARGGEEGGGGGGRALFSDPARLYMVAVDRLTNQMLEKLMTNPKMPPSAAHTCRRAGGRAGGAWVGRAASVWLMSSRRHMRPHRARRVVKRSQGGEAGAGSFQPHLKAALLQRWRAEGGAPLSSQQHHDSDLHSAAQHSSRQPAAAHHVCWRPSGRAAQRRPPMHGAALQQGRVLARLVLRVLLALLALAGFVGAAGPAGAAGAGWFCGCCWPGWRSPGASPGAG